MPVSSTAFVVQARKSVPVSDVRKYDVLASYKQRVPVLDVLVHQTGKPYFNTELGFLIPKNDTIEIEVGEQVHATSGASLMTFLEDALMLVRAEAGDKNRLHTRLACFNNYEFPIVALNSLDDVMQSYCNAYAKVNGRQPFPEYESEDQ